MIGWRNLATALVVATIPCVADAACSPRFESVTETVGSPVVNPFEASPYTRGLKTTIFNGGDTHCRLRLGAVDTTQGPRRLRDTKIEYVVRGPNNVILPNRRQPSTGYDFDLQAGQRTDIFLSLGFERPIYQEPINTEAQFTLRLLDQDDPSKALTEQDARVGLQFESIAQVNVAGTSGAFGGQWSVNDIDFGELKKNESRTVFLQVRSNSAIKVSLLSTGRGRLQHADSPAVNVPYSAALANTALPLANGVVEVLRPRSGGLNGVNLPLRFTIGALAPYQLAGRYTDTLTIEVEAQDAW
jgi:hypothetical protein